MRASTGARTEPPIIPAREALGAALESIAPGIAVLTGARWVEYREGLSATERAEKLLRTACINRDLTLIVIDPRTGARHSMPVDYCNRPASRFIFHRATFKVTDLDDHDPLYLPLRPYDGWPVAFFEPEFRAWLARIPQSGEVTPDIAAAHEQPSGGIRTNKAAAAEKACRREIAKLNERPANKEVAFEAVKMAVASIGPLSRKAFERAWASAAPAKWKKGGRRRKITATEI